MFVTAEQFLALADALRSYAAYCGRDLNASNQFVHDTLLRALAPDGSLNHKAIDPRRLSAMLHERDADPISKAA
jgi:hypothetical protein